MLILRMKGNRHQGSESFDTAINPTPGAPGNDSDPGTPASETANSMDKASEVGVVRRY
jgi:hypothetical protein